MTRRGLPLLLLLPWALTLGGCFDMPHPFADPGNEARRLVRSNAPPARLAVPAPTGALLNDRAAALWSHDMAQAMLGQSVPAEAQAVRPGDWWLKLTATRQGENVIPHFVVITPKGQERGHADGPLLPAAPWIAGDPAVLAANAQAVAPQVAATLTGIQAAMMAADPNSLMRRPARVWFAGVTGAPGDGNVALAQAFVTSFPDPRDMLAREPKGADYTVRCVVTLADEPAGTTGHPQQRIELAWHVVAADGKEAGAATQLHEIDAHSLDHAWGDVAAVAAAEAAGGVRQIISGYSGRDHKPAPQGS
ncbi:hypothetical protein [Acidomonas methanolica]|uniref:Lipoprotein n=1 Tax=Acidomonas methanolica NBRC 104435 TaxID=1231351 RepID=A0A023D230_ACIMT|nr:hypothetical protein [Acidomonas methanolica]MBU2654975.1 hypothetical protein [Acidomonas methanolica]TCS26326.1 hypothetical protein EDC31_11562 [Acidomonas methanolica]GAJ27820.1 hypothetical protein Amme_006_051 [Acidomonas methanolica NBRC 104435]GEK99143.1 hypothetical protein AME01nite_16420 [Acidomonas methanolica NBRC 104435]